MGKSVEELKDALAEIQASMRARCLAAFGYDEAKTARLIEEFAMMSRRLEDRDLTDLERLAAEQIITCWIQTTVSGFRLEGLEPGQEGGRMASFLEHRHNMAHNRLLRSMEMLSKLQAVQPVAASGTPSPGVDSMIAGTTKRTLPNVGIVSCGPPDNRHLVWTQYQGDNPQKVFAVRSTVMEPGGKYDVYTVVRRGDGWERGQDDVESDWDSDQGCMAVVPNYWSIPG